MIKMIAKIVLFCLVLALVPLFAHADDVAVSAPVGFEWLGVVIGFLQSYGPVGQILAKVFAIIAIVAPAMTYISVAAHGILTTPALMLRWSGAKAFADKIDAISAKVIPWLKYLSIFNVQKSGPSKSS